MTPSAPLWKAVAASVQGTAHRETNTPCQDAHAFAVSDEWLVAAVCDGAGSAPYAAVGARVGAHAVVDALVAQCAEVPPAASSTGGLSWREMCLRAIGSAREAVASALPEDGAPLEQRLAGGHATLVAVVATPAGGVFAHIGDGLAAAITDASPVVSGPANGAYANETFFLTQPDWQDHLRLTEFTGPFRALLLCSDGATALATEPDGRLLPGFIDPLSAFLGRVSPDDGRAALHDTLSSERAARLTGDDLTVFWASPASPRER